MVEIVLSVVIPYYNAMVYLPKLLNSIPDISEIEVIVVDDHSTEDREAYANFQGRCKNRNIRFLENPIGKKGAGAARNTGLEVANGKYLLFADSDDWFTPNMWEDVKRYIKSNADVIYFPPISKNQKGELENRHTHYAELVQKYIVDPSCKNELCLRYLYWSPCSKVIKRELVEKENIRYDEIRFSNDMMFSTKIGYAAKSIAAGENIIYCILSHSGSLTTNTNKNALMLRQKVYCNYYFFLMERLSKQERKLLGYNWRSDFAQYRKKISILFFEFFNGKLEEIS